MDDKITITLAEYNKLKQDSETLRKLELYGVDNWQDYCTAINDEEGYFADMEK